MNKQTLSNYGWIIIAVLVLVIMIALATPFARYIFNGTDSAANGFYDSKQNALNAVGIDIEAIYVKTEADLMAALTKQQKHIKFGDDITIHDTLVVPYNLTIDLNGHALQQVVENKRIFEIESGVTLQIIDKFSEAYRHTFSIIDGNHFVMDDAGTIAIYAGYIGGSHGNFSPFLVRGTLIIDSITIAGNYCSGDNGVFAILGGGHVTLNNMTIMNNIADGDGGISKLSSNATIEMNGGYFTSNEANIGSTIYLNGGTFSMNSGRIGGNTARDKGGVYIVSGVIMQNAGAIEDPIIDTRK